MNIKPYKKIFLLLIAAILIVSVRAAVPFERDTGPISPRHMSSTEINKYKMDKAFKYRDTGPEETGILSIISYYIERFFRRLFGAHIGSMSIYRIILYVMMILAVIMIIFQFLRLSPQGLFSRSSPSISVDSTDGDNIHEIDFDRLIQQSAAQQDYRLAVRFWYLKMLKVLSDAELIRWEISKTNYDYYYELKQQALRNEFLTLTDTFENSWYGNHNMSDERYKEATALFQSFFTTLRSS